MQKIALKLLASDGGVDLVVKVDETDGDTLRVELEAEPTEAFATLKEVDQISLGDEQVEVCQEESRARTSAIRRRGASRRRGLNQ